MCNICSKIGKYSKDISQVPGSKQASILNVFLKILAKRDEFFFENFDKV